MAYWRRFVPGLRRLRDRIAAGEFGVIHLVTCYQWDEQPPSAAFRAHSGGIAIDMGVHEFDQLRWLTGQDISGLAVVASGQAPDGIADVDGAQVIATLSGGGCGFISLGRYYPAGDAVWAEVFGTRGSERCDVIDPAEGERAQLEALRRQAESFAEFASRGAVRGGHRRRRGRGADRRRAGHRGDTGDGSGMNAEPSLRVGIIGYGVMGKAHSYGYRVAPMLRRLPVTPVVTVMSGRDAGAVTAAAAAYGVPATVTDWRELIARDDVDMVDICTPPGTHAQMARAGRGGGQGGAVREAAGPELPGGGRGAGRGHRGRGAPTRSGSTTGGCPRWRSCSA